MSAQALTQRSQYSRPQDICRFPHKTRSNYFSKQVSHLWNITLVSPTWAILADKIVLHVASIIIPLIKVRPSQTRVCSWLMIHHNTGFTSTGRLICIPISSGTHKDKLSNFEGKVHQDAKKRSLHQWRCVNPSGPILFKAMLHFPQLLCERTLGPGLHTSAS